jgi:hypothetical protein
MSVDSTNTFDAAVKYAQATRRAQQMGVRPELRDDLLGGRLRVRKAAVLGAGVMGAQIAAHLANANVKPILFDLPKLEGGDKSAIARKAIEGLAKLEPSPLATRSALAQITPANYDEHLNLLSECDLVIEAISERMDWKKDLFNKVAPPTPRGSRSPNCRRRSRPCCASASAASTSSIRRATCAWSS